MLDLLLLFLATWRITSIVQRERVAERFRRLFGEYMDEELGVYRYPDTFLGHLIMCFWCVSVWAGLFCTALYLVDVRLLLPFAASAAAILLDKAI